MIPFKIDPWILDNVFCVAFVSGNINASQESTHFHWSCCVAINFLMGTKFGGANLQITTMLLCSASASSFESRHHKPQIFECAPMNRRVRVYANLKVDFLLVRGHAWGHILYLHTRCTCPIFSKYYYYYSTFKILIIFSTVQSMIQSQELYLRYAIKRLWSTGISSRAMRIWSTTVVCGWVRAFVRMCVKQEPNGD